jgi:hypothetical protein
METKIPQTKNEAFAQLDAMLSEKELVLPSITLQ